mmetsp:Transcript_112055/g.313278  ORF Transcript_112055/g.313278 Transcript_112055/m.313278 type:complete len:314 (+) Transcript_112055:764-1705(+)
MLCHGARRCITSDTGTDAATAADGCVADAGTAAVADRLPETASCGAGGAAGPGPSSWWPPHPFADAAAASAAETTAEAVRPAKIAAAMPRTDICGEKCMPFGSCLTRRSGLADELSAGPATASGGAVLCSCSQRSGRWPNAAATNGSSGFGRVHVSGAVCGASAAARDAAGGSAAAESEKLAEPVAESPAPGCSTSVPYGDGAAAAEVTGVSERRSPSPKLCGDLVPLDAPGKPNLRVASSACWADCICSHRSFRMSAWAVMSSSLRCASRVCEDFSLCTSCKLAAAKSLNRRAPSTRTPARLATTSDVNAEN